MQTEYQFKLPKGYRSEDGGIHKEGFMRLATAKDEIEASRHPKAKAAPEYATIILPVSYTHLDVYKRQHRDRSG